MDTAFPKTEISVIVPVCNGGEKFRRCLTSLKNCMPSPKEIIVVVDGATDNSQQIAQEFSVRILHNTTPMGPSGARNMGAKEAKGDILMFIDADVVVSPDVMDCVASAFQTDPELAACFGSYDDDPLETNFLSQFKNLFHHYHHQTASEDAFTFWGACGAIKQDVFSAMNGFDEKYQRPSVEDIEFGYRLNISGYRIKLLKDLQVKHLKRWNVFSLLRSDIVDRALPWTELIWEKRSINNDLNLKYSNRFSIGLAYGLVCSLFLGFWHPVIYWISAACGCVLFILNLNLYRFLCKKQNAGFVVRSILWHWLYYLYCGGAFVMGTILHLIKSTDLRKSKKGDTFQSHKDRKEKEEFNG